mmetsp:Transcript_6813/g.11489  ORF Transcript_6813/g.11489 Transcript_6813/m.11489 type:complete len:310 (+) Transcript_6813:324-1253(+)
MKQLAQNKLEARRVDLKDFPNSKKKLVVQNIPLDVSEHEINQFFFTVLAQVADEPYNYNPITAVQRYPTMGFVTLEFRKRQDSEYILKLDDVQEYSEKINVKMKINRVPRFIEMWNDQIAQGRNPIAHLIHGASNNFTDDAGGFQSAPLFGNNKYANETVDQADDNELFMGGIPNTMSELKVKELCESFGLLKKFLLCKDPNNPNQNRGYCFFEYVDPRATEKAIKHLNNMEFKDKRLKVQRKSQGQKMSLHSQIKGMHFSVPEAQKFAMPLFAMNPSRCVQFMNMITPSDLFDEEEIFTVKDDLVAEC